MIQPILATALLGGARAGNSGRYRSGSGTNRAQGSLLGSQQNGRPRDLILRHGAPLLSSLSTPPGETCFLTGRCRAVLKRRPRRLVAHARTAHWRGPRPQPRTGSFRGLSEWAQAQADVPCGRSISALLLGTPRAACQVRDFQKTSCSMQVHVLNFRSTPARRNQRRGPDIARFLRHVKEGLTRSKDPDTFGLLNSKYAERFEEVWSDAKPLLERWAREATRSQRSTVIGRSRLFWTEGLFPKASLLKLLVRISLSIPLLSEPLDNKPLTFGPCSPSLGKGQGRRPCRPSCKCTGNTKHAASPVTGAFDLACQGLWSRTAAKGPYEC